MRIITLNCWGGRVFEPLMRFFERAAMAADVFCLQEVLFGSRPEDNEGQTRDNLFTEIARRLTDFTPYSLHAPPGSLWAGHVLRHHTAIGQATFVRKSLAVQAWEPHDTYPATDPFANDPATTMTGHMLTVTLQNGTMIANLHGIWQREGKGDTPLRLSQSRMVESILGRHVGPLILCGDFNMRPDTAAFGMLRAGRHDLVDEKGLLTTRSPLYGKAEPYSDYILVSWGSTVTAFASWEQEAVSDHLPLIADMRDEGLDGRAGSATLPASASPHP